MKSFDYYKKGEYQVIFTEEQFFVMNDNGKTIGNYKPIEIKQTERRQKDDITDRN